MTDLYDEIVDDLCATRAHVSPGRMFGMACFMANGKAAGGLWHGDMVFKLTDPTVRDQALALDGAHAFDPTGGRPMREWVVVPAAQASAWAHLAAAAVD